MGGNKLKAFISSIDILSTLYVNVESNIEH
jgi:hypothetical protein